MEHKDLLLFIQLRDGQPVEHPIFYENFRQAFPDIDPENVPADRFAKFVRVARPQLGLYEVYVGVTYQWVDGVVKDVHEVRPMTDEEKAARQQPIKDKWASRPQAENWAAWTFDESSCNYVPPIPRPEPDQTKLEQKIFTFWSGADNYWKDTPPMPMDNKQYKFDFFAWEWIEVASGE